MASANDEEVAQVLVEVRKVGLEVGGRERDRVVRDEAVLGAEGVTVRLHLDFFLPEQTDELTDCSR